MSKELSSATGGQSAAEDVRRTLSFLMPDLARFWALPLKDYASAVYAEGRRGRCSVRDDAMIRFRTFVARIALRSGASQDDAENAGRQIAASPVIQTGPHCHLLIEPDAFYTHLFSALGLTAHAQRWHICYGSSTVKFIEKAKKGPGWLSLGGEVVNVFGLPRSRMDPYSVCGFNGPYRLTLTGQNAGGVANPAAARLKAILPDTDFPSAAEAIRAANQDLWRRSFPPSLRLLQFDDIDVADLVAEHFEDPTSWLSSRFSGDGLFAERILHTMERLNAGPWTGWIRQTTDFFWGLEDGRISPLRLQDGVLASVSPSFREVRFDPGSLAASLRQRNLVPNLLMTFLVMSILPGVRVLGGCRQTVYYPLMRYLIATALDGSSDRELLDALRADERPGMWGHRVLRPNDGSPFKEIEESGVAMEVADRYGAISLQDAAGDLASFTSDPIWAELSAHIRAEAIHPASAEWQWA
ncbi:hypothetical protein FHS26_006732 [Rhizobium pisi]|uniref:Uncharacterized protein n=1 Tax=Rhizobium pisi TaxID=574561 RepID=A0A3R8ZZ66_9HYPH|nr:hypothetical protein [Rhizobium pisi]MBB3138952.1 hypothetical protein [Rhizobium pisi]RSB59995.1 hypothetical protein EFD55_32050 [Rhizobium pisi]TCA42215.1 hypothetical protein E0J16_33495 [Rhizobium pisi]